MKHSISKLIIILLAFVVSPNLAKAYDFSVSTTTSQMLYYDILSDSTVAVTYPCHEGSSYYAGVSMPVGNLLIPSTVTHQSTTYSVVSVGSHAFDGCLSLLGVILPSTITQVSAYAFYGCTGLSSIFLSNSVSAINDYAFANCHALQSLVLPETVSIIGIGAFQGCSLLSSVMLNQNLVAIGNLAFSGCTSLTAIAIPNSVTLLGNWVFNDCSSLDSVSLGSNISTILQGTFMGCNNVHYLKYNCIDASFPVSVFQSHLPVSALSELVVGDSVVSIPPYSFAGASVLSSVAIGSSVSTIGDYAFYGCDSLAVLHIVASVPPTVAANTFPSNHLSIEVPCDAMDAYQSAAIWSNFDSFVSFYPYTVSAQSANVLWGSTSIILQPTCDNDTAQFLAQAMPGYHFLRWSNGSASNPLALLPTANITITAYFASDYSDIIVASSDTAYGNVVGSGNYYYMSSVPIQALPYHGYHFVSWNDGLSDNPRYITINQDSSFIAIFAPDTFQFSALPADSTMGLVSGSGYYPYTSQVLFEAQPHYGYHFVRWNDGETVNPRSCLVVSDSSLIAYFAPNAYTVTLVSNDSLLGTTSGDGSFAYQTLTQISAQPQPHYRFSHWSDGVTDNPRTLVVSSDTTLCAIFVPIVHTISGLTNDSLWGIVQGSGSYSDGSSAILKAVPQLHCYFVSWSDGATSNPRVVSVTCDTAFTAVFSQNPQFEIVVSSNDSSLGTVSGSGMYYYTDTVIISAAPQGDHICFYSWDDGSLSNPRSVQVFQDAEYKAIFGPEILTFDLTSNNDLLGVVYGRGSYPYGSQVTALAVPADNSHFIDWSDGATDNPRSFVLESDMSLQANFMSDYEILSIDNTDSSGFTVLLSHLMLTVTSTSQNPITVFDILGRVVSRASNGHMFVQLPHPGIYLVKVGQNSVQKISAL